VVAAVLAHAGVATAECPKPRGKPMYQVTRSPLHEPAKGEAASVQAQTFSVFATGRWVWAGADGTQTGCIGPMAMKEINRALTKARFRVASGIVTTCAALPIARVKYAWLRRGKRVTTDEPCGIPVDKTTATLARCAEEAARETPPGIDELRTICRGEE
jgi:hypothetical protein